MGLVERLRDAFPATQDMRSTMLGDLMDEAADEIERLRAALTVAAAVLQGELDRSGGEPFSGRWTIPAANWRGTADEALDLANAALEQNKPETRISEQASEQEEPRPYWKPLPY